MKKHILTLMLLLNSVLFAVSQPRILDGSSYDFFLVIGQTNLDCTDTIIVDRKVYTMNTDPLYSFNTYKSRFKVSDRLHPELQQFSSIRPAYTTRLYRSTWRIRQGRLYLCHVEPDFNQIRVRTEVGFELEKQGISYAQYWAGILPPKDSISKRIEQLTGRKFKNKLMFADWYSGTLDVGHGIPASYPDRWKLDVKMILTIEKGVVVKREDITDTSSSPNK